MSWKPSRTFFALFIGLVVSGAALVLTLPAIFGPHESSQAALTMILGGVTAIFAIGIILMRPKKQNSAE
ncbi:hypothetical protein E3T61_13905 [Cryobacterium lactosi]|uniref:Uncharacterized protein n=1 Tax=Cryobacterium lactosi TaxID=1259202 RepID=A0A4R9BLN4_9MICO|nr:MULTISPECIES: hypothetical protein [Cryobacterium]RZI36179.1 hypothetical protein BJQ95_01427 [Cryobacterium sp. SO1]TFD86962.1 hypothetical protein E3T61_13905 [Cryobacterium lactosi]